MDDGERGIAATRDLSLLCPFLNSGDMFNCILSLFSLFLLENHI